MAGPHPLAITVDRIACDGSGFCAELLPERIDLDDWGYPIISPEPVSSELADRARRAVARCPVLALKLRPIPQAVVSQPTGRRTGDQRSTEVRPIATRPNRNAERPFRSRGTGSRPWR
jgi:ferredoxin